MEIEEETGIGKLEEIMWELWVELGTNLGFEHMIMYAPDRKGDGDPDVVAITFSFEEEYVDRIMKEFGEDDFEKIGGEDVHKSDGAETIT